MSNKLSYSDTFFIGRNGTQSLSLPKPKRKQIAIFLTNHRRHSQMSDIYPMCACIKDLKSRFRASKQKIEWFTQKRKKNRRGKHSPWVCCTCWLPIFKYLPIVFWRILIELLSGEREENVERCVTFKCLRLLLLSGRWRSFLLNSEKWKSSPKGGLLCSQFARSFWNFNRTKSS